MRFSDERSSIQAQVEQNTESQSSQDDHQDQGHAGSLLVLHHPGFDGPQLSLLLKKLGIMGVHWLLPRRVRL